MAWHWQIEVKVVWYDLAQTGAGIAEHGWEGRLLQGLIHHQENIVS